MTKTNLDRKAQLTPMIQEFCTNLGVMVEFLEPRRSTDIFILMLRGDKGKVHQAHHQLAERLNSEEVEMVAERERGQSFVLSLVVMEKPEAQSPQVLERRNKLQEVYKTVS